MSRVIVKQTPNGITILANKGQNDGGCPFSINLQNNLELTVPVNGAITFSNLVYPAPAFIGLEPSCPKVFETLPPFNNQLEAITAVVIKCAGSYTANVKGKITIPVEQQGELKVAIAVNGVVNSQTITTADPVTGEVVIPATLLNLAIGDQITFVNVSENPITLPAIPNVPNASITVTKINNI